VVVVVSKLAENAVKALYTLQLLGWLLVGTRVSCIQVAEESGKQG
jgi:hypothetical protein